MEQISCIFCNEPAIEIHYFDKGCVCIRNPGSQALCQHHIIRATPLGNMTLVKKLYEEDKFMGDISRTKRLT